LEGPDLSTEVGDSGRCRERDGQCDAEFQYRAHLPAVQGQRDEAAVIANAT